MKVVMGLGNPGPEYDATRHNVGWWVVDRLAYDWDFETFRREGRALVSEGWVGDESVRLVKPTTYMNRSGLAVGSFGEIEAFDLTKDLLVVVDDAALDVGKVRFRPDGSAGGHNGLKSVSGALQSEAYARIRIGVGRKPEGIDLADWVLSPLPGEDEEVVVGLLPDLTKAVEVWVAEGVEAAMNRFNR
ncbi:MAG: aminoacyl-tRNA hydrolase [Gemmatimonadetes bacterium]|nr:aminoacyl-tRNA hydrolase [Gemmatimonadota bacterium]